MLDPLVLYEHLLPPSNKLFCHRWFRWDEECMFYSGADMFEKCPVQLQG